MKNGLLNNRVTMKLSQIGFVMLLTIVLGAFPRVDLAKASMYDANMIERLQLTGTQKQAMQKVIGESRSSRDRIFSKYGIDPNARPQKSLLQRASSELMANAARERAAAKKILTRKQMYRYDSIIAEVRSRIISSF
jgi:Spy/CpxP family protein refolding chaperone